MQCLLCAHHGANKFYVNKHREFYRCDECDLIFVPNRWHLTPSDEKKLYDFHNNSYEDEGYKCFLQKIVTPLLNYLTPGMQGLDFGSGPGPTIHKIMDDAGYSINIYDPLYANYLKRLNLRYDFVTCTEVVEHFCNPYLSWTQLAGLVKETGYLAVMTLLHQGDSDFGTWWYKNDLTHVAFYSRHTIEWIAKHFCLNIKYTDNERVILFFKRSNA